MPLIYVAFSRGLSEWGASVGLTKHIYLVGVAEDGADEALAALNKKAAAGQTDWRLLKKQKVEALDEAAALARLAARETAVDPAYYPRLKGLAGVFKVKPVNVENQMMVQRALANEAKIAIKLKPTDIAAYLILNAIG